MFVTKRKILGLFYLWNCLIFWYRYFIRLTCNAFYRVTRKFLGAFSKFRKATISFIIFVSPSVCPHGPTRLPVDGIWWNFILQLFFPKSVEKIRQEQRVLYKKDFFTFMIIFPWIILKIRNISHKRCRENQNTYLCSIGFFFKSCSFWDNVGKYSRTREATGDNINTAHALCMLDK